MIFKILYWILGELPQKVLGKALFHPLSIQEMEFQVSTKHDALEVSF